MSTADAILDLAEHRIMTRGYNAFSYHDLAEELGIKTSSIHYYFAKKADLGVAVVKRYTLRIVELQNQLDTDKTLDEAQKLDRYLEVFLRVSESGVHICLCGALGAEITSLPEQLQALVTEFFQLHEVWLAKLLDKGRKKGAFSFEGSPVAVGKVFFAALEGGLLIARSRNDPRSFAQAVKALKTMIQPSP